MWSWRDRKPGTEGSVKAGCNQFSDVQTVSVLATPVSLPMRESG